MLLKKLFINSKIGQKLVILLLIAVAIPTIIITLLSNQKMADLIANYEHKLLLEQSRSYALSTFSNLIYARNELLQATESEQLEQLEQLTFYFESQKQLIFNSITSNQDNISKEILSKVNSLKPGQVGLIVLPALKNHYAVKLIVRTGSSFIVGELNQRYIWGQRNDYPSNVNVCAYQVNKSDKTEIFCSTKSNLNSPQLKTLPLNSGAWELFLAGEFSSNSWLFEVKRLTPMSADYLKNFVDIKYYIAIAALCALSIGLLSLIIIRKAMLPLELLTRNAKSISTGDFSSVEVEGSSEFSTLALAFNQMSSYIKKQFDTLQSLSSIDKDIASKISVDKTVELVMKRMQVLAPDVAIMIATLEDSNDNSFHFACITSNHGSTTSSRLDINVEEADTIKSYNQGRFKQPELNSTFDHERLMAELGVKNLWVLPIFWQGQMLAFLSIDSISILKENFEEFRELSSRIAVTISSYRKDQKLLIEAQYDNLTGLPNRILLQDRMKTAIEHSNHTEKPFWVLFIDLDRFKNVNDSLGHTAGDSLLKEMGSRLLSTVQEEDTVARFGGDEFVVILRGDKGESLQLDTLNRLIDSISLPMYLNKHELINTCSIGIATYPNDGKNVETIIQNADIAMYHAKEIGRNNYHFYKESLNAKASERLQMVSFLSKALEGNEFSLHYQPKVDLITNRIVGLEALIRWNNTVLGNVSPAQFIPLAEETGLIGKIGEWVLRTACAQMTEWHENGLGNLLMSVNISSRQLQDDGLIDTIKTILVETGLKTKYLELELTESMLMNNSTESISKLNSIKSLGIQLSVDDFGTGYSSLSYLHTLPIDTLKIDKAFTDTITTSTKKAPVVDTIISLAKSLNLKVVAEGVEIPEQAVYLKKHGCNQIQGYYFSKPLPADATTELLASDKILELPKLKLVKDTLNKA